MSSSAYTVLPGAPRTLLSYITSFGVTASSYNNGSSIWDNGRQTLNLISISSPNNYFTRYNRVKLFQGDGDLDDLDWVIFNFDQDSNGDFDGNSNSLSYFGGEYSYNGGTGLLNVTYGVVWGLANDVWNKLFQMSLPGNGGFNHSFAGWWESGNTVSSGDGKYTAYDTLDITHIAFSVHANLSSITTPDYPPPAFSMQVDAGTDMISTSKKNVPGFPTSFMQTNSSWFVSSYFSASSLGQDNWKPIVGSAYTTVTQTGFWGFWLSKPNDYIHWRNFATPQFNDDLTSLRVEVKDLLYEVIVKYDPANKKELKFALRKQNDNTSITRQTITQTADFSITGVLGNVTSGGWELDTMSMEIFHGKIERVSIGVIPTRTTLSTVLRGGWPNLEVPQTFTFSTTPIGENIMVNIDKSGSTLTSSPSSNISITKVSTDNWTVTISATGTYTLTYTFVDPNDFFPTITTSATVKMVAIPVTLGDFNDSRTFGTGSFNVIQPSSPSTGAFTYSITSGTDVISISGTTITILQAGSATIQASQAASGSYLAATKTATINITPATPTLGDFNDSRTFGTGSFNVIQPSSPSTGTFSYSVISGTDVISISGTTITILKAGSATIQAFQTASTNYVAVTKNATININRAAGTLSVTKSIFYQKFVSGASVPFDVIYSNAGTVSRTHESNNTSIVSIPSSSSPAATIVGPGKTTIKVTQPQQTNYEQIIEYSLVAIVIIGSGLTYSSENMTSLDLTGTNLSGSAFSSCILTSANLFGATVNASTNLSSATLTNVRSGRIIGTTSLLPSGFKMI